MRSTPEGGLGSTTVTANADGSLNSELRYIAFGEIRYNNGLTPTDYRYTGQLEQASINLYWYRSRWFDGELAHFVQADTLIPDPGDQLAWDRYAYVKSNPINYSDPDGHCPILIGAGVGILAGGIIYGATSIAHGRDFSWADFGTSLVVGAAGGALIGTGVGASAGIAAMASIGAGAGVIGSQIGYSIVSGKNLIAKS